MKRFFIFSAFLTSSLLMAQQGIQEQIKELKEKSDKFNVYLNFQSSFDAQENNGELHNSFKARQLRLEFRGNINENIYYRLRHRLNRSTESANLDNLARATDMMYVGFKVNDKWAITAGKMCQAWGGFEFDTNPMNIYEYSDMVENMDNFMLGAMVTYTPNKNHEFNFQVTNVRNNNFETLYPNAGSFDQKTNTPLTYIFNWNGNLFNNFWQTRYSIGFQQESNNTSNDMILIGNKFNWNKVQWYIDYMYANEGLDRLGYASVYTLGSNLFTYPILHTNLEIPIQTLKDVTYNSFVTKIEYQPSEKWNIFAQGMYESARVSQHLLPTNFYDNKRDSYGYFGGVEYLPFKNQDLRIFAAYIGRSYSFEKSEFNYDTNRFSLGIMYRIKAF